MSIVSPALCAWLAGSALGLMALPAVACTQRIDYPLTLEEATSVTVHAVEYQTGWAYVRYMATRVVDDAMQADLDASVAAGCRQTVRGPDAYGSVTAVGYAEAGYSIHTTLSARRPDGGKYWLVGDWQDELAVGRFGGTLSQTHRHKGVSPGRLAGRARVGDVLEFWSGGKAEGIAFGDPDGLSDVAAVSYGWGDAPAVPVITIWRP